MTPNHLITRQPGRLVKLAFRTVLAGVFLGGAPAAARDSKVQRPAPSDPLAEGFRDPPPVARPHVWWHWMSGNVTEEGARLDLEWMQRIGVGGVHAFSGGVLEKSYVPTPLPFMSDGWRDAYRASVTQAHRAGMDVVIAGSPGWSQTGGPWVQPADGMKKYGWSIVEVVGGRPLTLRLPDPPLATGAFPMAVSVSDPGRPQASGNGPVIAFPVAADDRAIAGLYTSAKVDIAALGTATAPLADPVNLPVAADSPAEVTISLPRPTIVRALTIVANSAPGLEILASDDGRSFRRLRLVAQSGAEHPAVQRTIALPETRARFFRVRLDQPRPWRELSGLPSFLRPAPAKTIAVRLLRLESGARVDHFEAKAGFQSIVDSTDFVATDTGIAPAAIVDLTDKMAADGTLTWTPPKGRWAILRYGWSLTGQTNGPAEPDATGLEVDKLDPIAVRRYVDTLFALYKDKAGVPLGKDGITSLLTDSWEAGVQNWTPSLLADFQRLRGYDPTPWLPVLSGYVVGDARRSDAFLFDFRRTLKELLVSAHYEILSDAAHRNGMTYYTEASGDTPRAISDGLSVKARADIPTGEFWYRPFAASPGQPALVADLREAASAAHLYGKPLIAAEAMTVAAGTDQWGFSPAMLKPVADEIFAHGVNRMLVHESHMQPFVDKRPGLMLGIFGQFFNRNDTWAEQAKPWVDYLARTSWMLQQGRYVADVAYFYGEEENLTQRYERRPEADVPAGYGFDYIGAEALLTKLRVQDGRIVTDSGMSYRMLYLPADVTRFSLPVLQRLVALLRAGAVIVAPKPDGGLGLASDDAAIGRIADAVWTTRNGPVTVGAGRLYAGVGLAKALASEHVPPDVAAPGGAAILSSHRSLPGADIYFVSNRGDRPIGEPVAFRVSGRMPEWWSAEDGTTRPLSYRIDGDLTRVRLPLEASGAGFVVFRRPAAAPRLDLPADAVIARQPVAGDWQVTFEPGRGAPPSARFSTLTDWSQSVDPAIRYFSGTATYRQEVHFSPLNRHGADRTMLELGEVRELATVRINGRDVGTAWHAPYRIDVTRFLRPGKNSIEIAVTNLWVNRLIGDKQPGAKQIAYAPQSFYKADSSLRQSGLLGPVTFVTTRSSARQK